MERVVMENDVIPLKKPIRSKDGKTILNSIRVRKGQVSLVWSRLSLVSLSPGCTRETYLHRSLSRWLSFRGYVSTPTREHGVMIR